MRKKIFCIELTRADKAEKKSLVPAQQAQRTNQGRIPFNCTLWVPIHLSFNSQQGPSLSSLSGHSHETQIFYCPCKNSCAPSSLPAPFINIFLFNQKVKSVKVFQGNLIWGPVCVWRGGGGEESADGNTYWQLLRKFMHFFLVWIWTDSYLPKGLPYETKIIAVCLKWSVWSGLS